MAAEITGASWVKVKDLHPRAKNPRKGNVALIRDSLEKNGQYRPIVVNRPTLEILAGNHTWLAARELGWEQIAVSWVDVDEETAARIVLVDNKANDAAGYDYALLAEALDELPSLEGTGYSQDDLDRLIARLLKQEERGDREDVPETPAETDIAPGDVFVLGRHRLICGDATDLDAYDRLMAGQKADCYLTDPPYNVDYEGKAGKIKNDHLEGSAFRQLLVDAFSAALVHVGEGCPAYVFHADTEGLTFRVGFEEAGWSLRQVLIWVKDSMVLGRQDYQWQHEPILYGWRPGAAHNWYGEHDKKTVIDDCPDPKSLSPEQLLQLVRQLRNALKTTVIREDKPRSSDLHPTTKPVGLLNNLLRNSTKVGDAVLDNFAGSGSTLIACEDTGRVCYAMELDPRFVAVIVKRWEDYTGEKARKEAA